MAPPPEYDKEPKAPDKSVTNISTDDSKVLYNLVKEQQNNSDHKPPNAAANADVENNKHVGALDDGQLRALLDEAIAYKRPKDREGKSSLFKELLEEVEQDEQACEAAARSVTGRRGARGSGASGGGGGGGGSHGRRALPHSNSLQDLMAAALAAEQPRQRAHAHPPPASVSARAHHGGSLPSGVDTSFMLSEEPTRGGYLATVRCVNPPPLAERRVSASDANGPAELEHLNRRSKPMFPVTYTARATLEIGSGSVCSGRAVTTTTPSNQVDAAIPFSCITTPEVVASCNTTPAHPAHPALPALAVDPKPLQLGSCYRAVSCLTGEPLPDATVSAAPTAPTAPTAPPAAPTHEQPRSVISSSLNGLPLTRSGFATGASASADESKKSLDENGNSVQGFSSPLSGSSHNKKPRRKKSSKNETVIKSQEIDGYQGNKDLNEVLRFIESNAESARSHKVRAKHKDDDDKGKKRSTERRKDKESKVKRASSLEELSRTTLADLTDHTDKPAPRPEPAKPKPERRSWGEDFADNAAAAAASAALELTDFQTVTKKRKPRRRTDEPEPPRRARPPAPPSDRSNDSNDDMDSVHSLHSLPADAPPARPAPPHPHASYADIARTRHNIPDLIESCNFYETEVGGEQTRTEPAPAAAPPAPDDYPSLEVLEARKKRDKPRPARKERNEGDAPAPDVVSDRRPAVILLDRASRPHDMDGVTFGFDINEQLVGARRPRCDLVRDALEGAVPVPVRAGPLRYLPPPPPPPAHQHTHLLQIVDYVGGAWEDVVRCGGGKVRYFSE
ncbi:PREDICTED: actin cytoskeleton-regulatory complex protein PAN1-like isoform X3 [Papilio xuthus]|uniref:Actin cytoskeleton-regulatory complex protein PAN1-like isoform X3 n=1 Tax=Papilio xuthus TaxID=66420 RepID=A0AAJ6Z8Q1_PAPXU|nr:PREDICTED: actin cytoskeleton-regulatory complex protein PAN1-like isoform X3 [Papilio xuthus]